MMSASRVEAPRKPDLAVLAFGSLLTYPGPELAEIISDRIEGVLTPFNVEYARSSSTRGGAPTLVPVEEGGGAVLAAALVIEAGVDLDEVRDRLYRRETDQVGSGRRYLHSEHPRPGHVWLPTTDQVTGVRHAVYTVLDANIPPENRTPDHLAGLAIDSVGRAQPTKDGITYLEDNLAAGIVTPLSRSYEAAILALTGTTSLAGARLASP